MPGSKLIAKHLAPALLSLVLLSSLWRDGVPGVLGQGTAAHNQDDKSSSAIDARAEIPFFYTTAVGSNAHFNANLLLQADIWTPGQVKSPPVESSLTIKDAKSSSPDPAASSTADTSQGTSSTLTMVDFSKVAKTSPSMTPSPSPEAATPTPSSQVVDSKCAPNEIQVSVEKVVGVFCVLTKSVCSDTNVNGECPGPQPGLLNGSHCTTVGAGVFGCHPRAPPSAGDRGSTKETGVSGSTGRRSSSSLPKCGAGAGSTFVSIVGKGTFCASGPICSGANFGYCPQVQEGLGKASRREVL